MALLRDKHLLLLTRILCIALWEGWFPSLFSVAKAGPWLSQMDEVGQTGILMAELKTCHEL